MKFGRNSTTEKSGYWSPGLAEEVLKKVFVFTKSVWTKLNDFVINIDTMPDIPLRDLVKTGRPYLQGDFSEKSQYHDNNWYESPDYWCIRKVAKIIKPQPEAHVVFYDLGSGKGRILCVMAQQPFKKVVGVELFEHLCEAARKNAQYMRRRKAPIEIVCDDVTRADISDGTVYFMFNPFGADTMREVIANIKRSLSSNPRDIIIIYYNPVHEDILKSCTWLHEYSAFYTLTRRRVSFWSNLDINS